MPSPDVVMTSPERKIQLGGWNKKSWKYIREKVKEYWDRESRDLPPKYKPKAWKSPLCRKTRRVHNYVIREANTYDSFFHKGIKTTYYTLVCTNCGKKVWTSDEARMKRLTGRSIIPLEVQQHTPDDDVDG